MKKTNEFVRYAISYACLRAWSNGEVPTINDLKGILAEDGISTDTINRFLPQWKYKEIEKNIPGLKGSLTGSSTLSDIRIIPTDINKIVDYVEDFNAKIDLRLAQRRVNDPEFRKFEKECKKGSPYLQKKWKEILGFKAFRR